MKKVGVVLAAALFLMVVAVLLTTVPVSAQQPSAYGQCKACHSSVAGKTMVGPSHFGVVGRKAGSVDGFAYSAAMKASGLTWDEATLQKYISDPKGTVPGNKMPIAGVRKADDVTAIIGYLKTLK